MARSEDTTEQQSISSPTDVECSTFWPPQMTQRPQNADNGPPIRAPTARTPSASEEALDRSRNESLRPDEPASNEATVQSFDSTSSAEDEDARHGTLMGAPRDDSRDENSDRATADIAYNVRNRNQALPAIRRDLSQLRCRVEQQIDGVLLSVQNTFDDLEQRIDRACWPDNNNNRPHVSKSNHIDDRGRGRGNVRRNRVGSRSRHHPSRRHRHNQDPIAGAERDIQEIQARLDLVDPHAHCPRHARARHHRYQLEPLLIVELDDSFDSAFGALDWISTFSALAREGFRRPPQRRHPRQCERRGHCVSLDRSHHRGRRDDPTFNFHNDVFGQASHAQLSVDSASDLGPAESDSSGRSGWFVLEYPDAEERRHLIHPGELGVLVGVKSMGTCLSLLREMLTLYDAPQFRYELATA